MSSLHGAVSSGLCSLGSLPRLWPGHPPVILNPPGSLFSVQWSFEKATCQGRGGRMGSLRPRSMVTQLLSGPPTHPSVYPSTQPTISIISFIHSLALLHTYCLTHPPTHPSIHSSFLFLIHTFLHSSTSPLSTCLASTLFPFGDDPPQQLPGEQEDHPSPYSLSLRPLAQALRGEEPTKAGPGVLGVGFQVEDWGEGKRLVTMDQICCPLSPSPHFSVKRTISQLCPVYCMNSVQPCPVSSPRFPHVADSACSDLLGV